MDPIELEKAIEAMSAEDKAALLAEDFGADLEKQAADEAAESDLQDALYAYGALTADIEVEAAEAGEAGLSKEASAEFTQAEEEISAAIEAGVQELGLEEIADEVEMHKTAMATAAIIFEGYCDQIEKIAAKSKKDGKGLKGLYESTKKHVAAGAAKAGKHIGEGVKMVKKHPGKAGMIAAGTAALGYGAHKLHEHMSKKASELTAAELVELTFQKQAAMDVVVDGIEKLAAHGAKKGGMLAKGMAHVRALHKKHLAGHGRHMAAGAGAGAGIGALSAHLAHRFGRKEK